MYRNKKEKPVAWPLCKTTTNGNIGLMSNHHSRAKRIRHKDLNDFPGLIKLSVQRSCPHKKNTRSFKNLSL